MRTIAAILAAFAISLAGTAIAAAEEEAETPTATIDSGGSPREVGEAPESASEPIDAGASAESGGEPIEPAAEPEDADDPRPAPELPVPEEG